MKDTAHNSNFDGLPVFQLTGGSPSERLACIDYIENGLRFAHLSVGVVSGDNCLRRDLFVMSSRYDLVLVDGETEFGLRRIYLDDNISHQKQDLYFPQTDSKNQERFCDSLLELLASISESVPVWACILIGGKSSRMGQPKHLIRTLSGGEESWLERTVEEVVPLVDGLVVSGQGELPKALRDTIRIPDVPGVAGPLTGLLSAMRWQPQVSWLVIACDMPFVTVDAAKWLLSEKNPGSWGRLPRIAGSSFCEPLFAWYDKRALQIIEAQLLDGNLRAGRIADHYKIDNPIIPENLAVAWKNVNTPEQLKAVKAN